MRVRRVKIDTELEKDILMGMIVSDRVCKEVMPAIKTEYFQIDYSKTVFKWVKEYFNSYNVAPRQTIQSIYLTQKEQMGVDIREAVENFLEGLSKRWEEQEVLNESYLVDQAMNYFRERALLFHADLVKAYVETGDMDGAEREMVNFRRVAKITSGWFNPFLEEQVESALTLSDEGLFRMPGCLGELFGDFKRGQLVTFMGPPKRGKTWWLIEVAVAALMFRLKVVFISLEMTKEEVSVRLYKRLAVEPDEGGRVALPVFDCRHNQDGSCNFPERKSKVRLLNDEGERPMFSDAPSQYEPCCACRAGKNKRRFAPDVWYEMVDKEGLSIGAAKRKTKVFTWEFGNNLRVIDFPMNTASITDIKQSLDLLAYTEDFEPDVVVLDYFDITGPEDPKLVGRDAINETWKAGKQLAQERKVVFFSATQANRDAIERKNVKQTNTGEDIRKLAHVNKMAVLNQTPVEKRNGIMRVGMLVGREMGVDEFRQVEVTQNLSIGQPYLDGEWLVEN